MTPFHPRNPEDIVQIIAQYARALVRFLFWSIVATGSLTATYVAARIIIVVAKTILRAAGVQ
jgi:hypothetical protein